MEPTPALLLPAVENCEGVTVAVSMGSSNSTVKLTGERLVGLACEAETVRFVADGLHTSAA